MKNYERVRLYFALNAVYFVRRMIFTLFAGDMDRDNTDLTT